MAQIAWTAEEDALLIDEVTKHGSRPDSWANVALAFNGTREYFASYNFLANILDRSSVGSGGWST